MKPWQRLLLIISLFCLPPAGIVIYGLIGKQSEEERNKAYVEINWNTLRKLDYKTGQLDPELQKLDGQRVKLPGYVVPLDDELDTAPEFLLVPSPQACVHVPPPPPNQMVLVRMTGGVTPMRSWGPVWIKGLLQIQDAESQFGKSSFKVIGEDSEKYKIEW